MSKVLGLDIGPNSIGWALIEDQDNTSGRLIDCGARVFPEGVDSFDSVKESNRNEQRRLARMMRRQISRRAKRKRIVTAALVEAKLLPADPAERAQVLATDPYPLRSKAPAERLDPFEIGRILYHLNKRRGFLSLKKVSKKAIDKELKALEKKKQESAKSGKADDENKKEDDKGMLAEIELLAQAMGDRTLGQHLHDRQKSAQSPAPAKIRGLHTRRAMLEEEFLRIWNFQSQFHPDLLTQTVCFGTGQTKLDALRTHEGVPRDHDVSLLQQFGLHGLIFFQRPIYWPREMIGMCELEPGCRRCHKADRRAQRFRMLQEINNLRYTLPGKFEERSLDDDQRRTLLEELYRKKEMKFDAIRKLLDFLDGVQFNLERGKRTAIKGSETDVRIAREFEGYAKLSEDEKDQLVRILIDAERDGAAADDALRQQFDLNEEQSAALLGVDLPDGYARLSLKAIDKLLPHLERGMILMGRSDADASAMHAAGYLRRDELQRRLFDKLPSLQTIHSGPLADLPNPVVRTAMHELRRVVNAIVREYGRPDSVHVEMARSMKMSAEKRKQYNITITERGKERARIADDLRSMKVAPTRDAVLKYTLWKQQKEICIYTGRSISITQLYDGSTDIDHILPYSLTLDDSQMNKIVCFRDANRDKAQRSPWQWLGGTDPKRLAEIEQRGACLPWTKRRKLMQEQIETDDFVARQLVDTGYIARLAIEYLKLLVEKDHEVQGRKGTYTADLRHEWGVSNLLEALPDSPAWQEKGNLSPGEKNRADHRHHALDAIIIALTSRKTLAAMHQGQDMAHRVDQETGEIIEYLRFIKDVPPPWGMDSTQFRQMVLDKLKTVNVSHRVSRQIRRSLHEETNYGPVHDQARADTFVVRKPVESLSMAEVEKIRDKSIRDIVIKRLKEHGIRFGRGADKVPPKLMQEAMKNLTMPSGVPIRKVRVLREDATIRPIRQAQAARNGDPTQVAYVKPGRNHHLCLFEWTEKGKVKRDAVFVTMLEAVRRVRAHEPIIQRTHPTVPEAKFLFSLSLGELVLANWKGTQKVLKFKTAASTQGQIYFSDQYDARASADYRKIVCNCNTIDARKITIDPLGRVRWAND